MGKIKDWIDWKIRGKIPTFTSLDFYLMLDYYDISTTNVAVIGNPSKYKWVVNNLLKRMKEEKKPDSKAIKISDDKYIFINNGIESTFVHINDIHTDLEANKIKYRRFM